MDRPLNNKRPLGPFAQMGGGCANELALIVHYGKHIPDEKREEAKGNLTGHLEAHGVAVKEARVGPDDKHDSIWVIVDGRSFYLDDAQSGVSASVAEMKDSNIKVSSHPEVEVIMQ